MKKRNNIITVAIDSPAAAGAGTQAKLIAKEYNLLYLDTGKIYRFIGKLFLENKNKFDYKFLNKKVKKLKLDKLKDKSLLSDKVASSASIIAKVTRDMIMHKLDREFPYYGWKDNAGYGTKKHLAAIEEYGVCEHHRRSFAPIRRVQSNSFT